MFNNRGKLIAFSGIDGAGKSTQINLLMDYLYGSGFKPYYIWTRGGYTGPFNFVKSIIRKIMGKAAPPPGRSEKRDQLINKKRIRNIWLKLAIIDLILIYVFYFRFLKLFKILILADRYFWDSWIDFKLNFPESGFDKWFLWRILKKIYTRPDHVFLLLIPVDESVQRSEQMKKPFPDTAEILQKRLEYYDKISNINDWHIINCMKSVGIVAEEIKKKLNEDKSFIATRTF